MDEFLQVIRSLNTTFVVLERTSDLVEIRVEAANFRGEVGPVTFSFGAPRLAWAARWNAATAAWENETDSAEPLSGVIREAFVKPVLGGIKLSFSDKSDPTLRWGFVADYVSMSRAPTNT